jgi:hypothetical protein
MHAEVPSVADAEPGSASPAFSILLDGILDRLLLLLIIYSRPHFYTASIAKVDAPHSEIRVDSQQFNHYEFVIVSIRPLLFTRANPEKAFYSQGQKAPPKNLKYICWSIISAP